MPPTAPSWRHVARPPAGQVDLRLCPTAPHSSLLLVPPLFPDREKAVASPCGHRGGVSVAADSPPFGASPERDEAAIYSAASSSPSPYVESSREARSRRNRPRHRPHPAEPAELDSAASGRSRRRRGPPRNRGEFLVRLDTFPLPLPLYCVLAVAVSTFRPVTGPEISGPRNIRSVEKRYWQSPDI